MFYLIASKIVVSSRMGYITRFTVFIKMLLMFVTCCKRVNVAPSITRISVYGFTAKK